MNESAESKSIRVEVWSAAERKWEKLRDCHNREQADIIAQAWERDRYEVRVIEESKTR